MKAIPILWRRLIKTMTLLLIALFTGCSPTIDQNENKWKERPKDFHVRYEWFSGTVSPPYQYMYTVEVGPDSRGKIVFGPTSRAGSDGPVVEHEPPPWTETFAVSDEDMSQLFELMSKSGVFNKRWKEAPPREQVIGGRAQWMRVEGNGESIQTPVTLKSEDRDAVEKVYDAIRSLAPKPLWIKLESQRQRYVEDYTSHQNH